MNQPAGWYPDSQAAGAQRYWNGVAWTEHRSPGYAPPARHPGPPPGALAMPAGTLPGEKSSGLAGFLSFLITGLGQLYAGDPARGVLWFVGIFVGWIVTWTLSLVIIGLFFIPVMVGFHIWCIIDAASCASNRNYQMRMAGAMGVGGPAGQAVFPTPYPPSPYSPVPQPAPVTQPALPPTVGLNWGVQEAGTSHTTPAPTIGERCPKETSASGKPKACFEDEADARQFIERNQHRYTLDHAYECPYYDHWHVS